MAFRKPTPDELRLLKELVTLSGTQTPDEWLKALRVEDMDDGGMGSLRIAADGRAGSSKTSVTSKAAVQFTDADGVEVIASLNADENGVPLELDVWKTDFSPLTRIPNAFRHVE